MLDAFAALWFFDLRRWRWLGRRRRWFGWRWLWRRRRRRWLRLSIELCLAFHRFWHNDSHPDRKSNDHERNGVHQLHGRGPVKTFRLAQVFADVPFMFLASACAQVAKSPSIGVAPTECDEGTKRGDNCSSIM